MADALPLFPLGVVLLPGMSLPLHIFEERYKLMIAECLEHEGEFGIVLSNGERMESAGCTAAVRRVLRRYPDGRMDVLTVGKRRFRILELREGRPWLEALVEPLQDSGDGGQGEPAELAARGITLLVQLVGMLGRPADLAGLQRLTPEEVSFRIAAAQGFSLQERQQALETTSTRERLERGVEALERILRTVRQAIEARRIVGGNGHMRGAFRE
jgi:Lon protease-like protein